jgi:microcystin-dependent protein
MQGGFMRNFRTGLSIFISLLFFALVFLNVQTAIGAPAILNYQGSLYDDSGNPVTGTKNIVFRIYAEIADAAAAAKWTSQLDGVAIPVKNGIFSVNLGEKDPFPAGLFDDDSLYLGVTVEGTPELMPRKRLTSVPYAMNSAIPKGGIIMWSGTSIPEGWALCNGQTVQTSSGPVITPNLSDRFIVGTGNHYSIGNNGGEAEHILTMAEMPSHTHTQDPHTHASSVNGSDGTTRVRGGGTGTQYIVSLGVESATATNQNTGGGAAHNNLPPYYALALIIKL